MSGALERHVGALVAHSYRLERRRWRQLVWLEGEPAACRRAALALWHARAWRAPLWVADPKEAPVEALSNKKVHRRLGGEHQLVILDVSGSQGLDPDMLGVLAGTLSAGGLCVLITPAGWGRAPDPDYARLSDYPRAWVSLTARYLARLAGILKASHHIVRWQPGVGLKLARLGASGAPGLVCRDTACRTGDQAQVVDQLVRLKRRRPLVITADRGRGKSAALGIACARLLHSGVSEIVVTAPSREAIQSLTERLEALCPQGAWQTPDHFALPSGQALRYLAPAALDAQVQAGGEGGDGAYLLVDEAAALPAALLARWLDAFPRVAFASTVHGYEGSGRGFALRFRDVLDRRTPLWRAAKLQTPVRWAAFDPLEAIVKRLLLLDAPLPTAEPAAALVARALSPAALAAAPALLEKLFGLLVQSHYRTAPSDLRQLMDGPGVGFRVIGEEEPQAVLVTFEEGGFDTTLADDVARGERRPRGHLLAQSLAAHTGSRAALEARWRRVARVATHPERRREGLGRALIEADMRDARAQGVALYGATFGAEASLLRFWRALGFLPVRLGVTQETSTGEYAVMVARALNAQGEAVLASLRAGFEASLSSLLAFELTALPANVVPQLLSDAAPALNAREQQDAQDVAYAHRDPALARASLQALARWASADIERAGCADEALRASLETLTAWAFQNRAPARAPREANQRLRQAVRALCEATLSPGEPQR
ncbi:GNAT family N-acetyltransferase [Halomonas sp. PAMB 3264]|uniref:GNAT family N-acetyltransferase n=1 Tax=Halomonas sp. PAMB 3264 TaxID=3075222 RepID=UPI0028A2B36A|nr:GNAT family N-acetyltransferase [Halomonas sp. PAMB 3264]WNL41773.1 GNAT family N-acetyltransferase [Halomonas sp. PAMB 3264]